MHLVGLTSPVSRTVERAAQPYPMQADAMSSLPYPHPYPNP
jgi:hypothetical protein